MLRRLYPLWSSWDLDLPRGVSRWGSVRSGACNVMIEPVLDTLAINAYTRTVLFVMIGDHNEMNAAVK